MVELMRKMNKTSIDYLLMVKLQKHVYFLQTRYFLVLSYKIKLNCFMINLILLLIISVFNKFLNKIDKNIL